MGWARTRCNYRVNALVKLKGTRPASAADLQREFLPVINILERCILDASR